MQFVVREPKSGSGEREVAAVDWAFNAYGGTKNADGSWQSKYGTLYATDMADARCILCPSPTCSAGLVCLKVLDSP